jgi:hypothetical protein
MKIKYLDFFLILLVIVIFYNSLFLYLYITHILVVYHRYGTGWAGGCIRTGYGTGHSRSFSININGTRVTG